MQRIYQKCLVYKAHFYNIYFRKAKFNNFFYIFGSNNGSETQKYSMYLIQWQVKFYPSQIPVPVSILGFHKSQRLPRWMSSRSPVFYRYHFLAPQKDLSPTILCCVELSPAVQLSPCVSNWQCVQTDATDISTGGNMAKVFLSRLCAKRSKH